MFVELITDSLFAINSCVNPFIYAKTIPAFKKMVQTFFYFPCMNKKDRRTSHEMLQKEERINKG